MRKYFVLWIVFLALLISVSYWSSNTYSRSKQERFRVLRVIDGDTIVVDYHGVPSQVRLVGMNTPETTVSGIPNECYGPEATKRTTELVGGKEVALEAEPLQQDRDIYGRLLRHVYIEGQNVGIVLVREGYARDWTDEYPSKYDRELKQAQADAVKNRQGLWGKCH